MDIYGCVTKITMTKKELLSLVAKLDRPTSAKALMRKGEDGNEYYIEAIPDGPDTDFALHPADQDKVDAYYKLGE